MATLLQLATNIDGPLFKLDPVLDADELENRLIYASLKLRDWIQNILPALETFFEELDVSPAEQLDELIATYASGLPLTFEKQFKPFFLKLFESVGDGVWYLKTADLRIFGWFAKKDSSVGVVPDTFEHVKKHNLYQGYRGEVVRFRNALPLDEPKFIPGDDPNAVISNYAFA